MNWFDVLKLQINIPKQKVRIKKPKKIEEEKTGCREKMKRVLDTWGNGKEDIASETLDVAKLVWDFPADKITIEDSYITIWDSGTGGKPIPKKIKHKGRGGVFDINLTNRHIVDERIGSAQFEGSETERLMEEVPEPVACKFLELLNIVSGKTEATWEQVVNDLEGWDLLGFTRYVPQMNRFGFTVIATDIGESWYEMSYLFELDPYYLQGYPDVDEAYVSDVDAELVKLLKEAWQQINNKVRSMI